jgi:hypothetical protein
MRSFSAASTRTMALISPFFTDRILVSIVSHAHRQGVCRSSLAHLGSYRSSGNIQRALFAHLRDLPSHEHQVLTNSAPNTLARTKREAKPVQTVRATYPPTALRKRRYFENHDRQQRTGNRRRNHQERRRRFRR